MCWQPETSDSDEENWPHVTFMHKHMSDHCPFITSLTVCIFYKKPSNMYPFEPTVLLRALKVESNISFQNKSLWYPSPWTARTSIGPKCVLCALISERQRHWKPCFIFQHCEEHRRWRPHFPVSKPQVSQRADVEPRGRQQGCRIDRIVVNMQKHQAAPLVRGQNQQTDPWVWPRIRPLTQEELSLHPT